LAAFSIGGYNSCRIVVSCGGGVFSFDWQPDIIGKYTLYASFAGSESYWSSSAVTAFTVNAATQSTPTQTTTPEPSMADLYFMPVSIGMIIAIIVVAALLALLLFRKK
jgi:hypothetical protein